MSRYIDADALIKDIENCSYETWSHGINRTWWAQAVKIKDNIKQCIERQPTADVVEVRHGHWIEHTAKHSWLEDDAEVFYNCSECGSGYWNILPQYCPNCGAKMDEKEQNHE